MSSNASVATSRTSTVHGSGSGGPSFAFGSRSGGSGKPAISGRFLSLSGVAWSASTFCRRRNWIDSGRSSVTRKMRFASVSTSYRSVAAGTVTIHWTLGSLPRMRRFFSRTRPGQVDSASSQSMNISSGFLLISARRIGPVRSFFAAIR